MYARMYNCTCARHCLSSPVCLSLCLPCRGALVAALARSTMVAGHDTAVCVTAVVGPGAGTVAADLRESSLADHIAVASVSTHGRLVAIILLTVVLVALCQLYCALNETMRCELRFYRCILGMLLTWNKLVASQNVCKCHHMNNKISSLLQ